MLSLATGLMGDAVWWQDGVIRAVGLARELERKVPSRVPRFDLPRTLITPGFVDGHTHFGLWAQNRKRVHLAGAGRRSEALRRIAAAVPERGWIRGHGWDANRWEDPPDRRSLDAVAALPAFLESVDIHAAWVNSPALALAGSRPGHPRPGRRSDRPGCGRRAHRAAAGTGGRAGPDRTSAAGPGGTRRRAQGGAVGGSPPGLDGDPRCRGPRRAARLPGARGRVGSSGSGCCFTPRWLSFASCSARG